MHYIRSQIGKCRIEEPCAGNPQARFCRGSHSTNFRIKLNFNLIKEIILGLLPDKLNCVLLL